MNLRALSLLGLLCVAQATAQPALVRVARTADAIAQREVLLMLRIAPAHYRPDASYGSDYQNAPGRVARQHVADELARAHGLLLHDEWPMPALGVDCFVLDAPDRAAALREAQALAADPRVESAQVMQLFHGLGGAVHDGFDRHGIDQHGPDPLYAAQPATSAWHLSELHALATGKGVRVAIIDSGIAVEHPDLRGQIALARNFVDDRGNVPEAHGTAVAGIIAAREGNGIGIVGIAPQARLLALRACWQDGRAAAVCSSFTLARALQFAIDAHPQVLNLSLSGPQDRLLARLLDVALARGINVVGAVDVQARDGGFPASHRGVLAVDSTRVDGMKVAGREHAPLPFVVVQAPGEGIPATLPDGGWGLVSGTSFATAQVSGLVALLRQRGPGLAPAQLLAALTGVPLAAERPRTIDVCAVMRRTVGQCVCACATASAAR